MGALFPFLSKVTETFCKIELKFLTSKVLTGSFAIGCAKKFLVSSIYKKSSRKVCSKTKSLRSQTKVGKLATLLIAADEHSQHTIKE